MIVNLEIIKQEEKLKDIDDKIIKRKLRAIEKSIRKYTNNNFLDTKYKFYGSIVNNIIVLNNNSSLNEQDNIQLSHSFNDSVYTIKNISSFKNIEILENEKLLDCKNVMITKVVYPEDVQEGVIDMLNWEFGVGKKIGIKSESLSRHSTTYFDMNKDNTLKGYPVALLGFLEDYIKARF